VINKRRVSAGVHNRPGAGRPFVSRQCSTCESEATYAVHVLTRTIGRGQTRARRAIKTSGGVLFCDTCARGLKARIGELADVAHGAISHVMRKQNRPTGPTLFDQATA
jgi:hypothetical protein